MSVRIIIMGESTTRLKIQHIVCELYHCQSTIPICIYIFSIQLHVVTDVRGSKSPITSMLLHVYVMHYLHLLLLSTIVKSSSGESAVVTCTVLISLSSNADSNQSSWCNSVSRTGSGIQLHFNGCTICKRGLDLF